MAAQSRCGARQSSRCTDLGPREAHYQGLYSRAAALCGESLTLSRSRGDAMGIANALHGLALVARSTGDFSSARTMYEEARGIHERMGDRWGLSYTLRYL